VNTRYGNCWDSECAEVVGDLIVFQTEEYSTNRDLNGDGDRSDGFLAVHRIDTRETRVLGEAAIFEMHDGLVVFHTPESWGNEDLNGDGDVEDYVIRYYRIGDESLTNTGAEGSYPEVHDGIIAFTTSEARLGADLNGDGDHEDYVARYHDVETGRTVNLGLEARDVSVRAGVIGLVTEERTVGPSGEDLSGDGDISDYVLRYHLVSRDPAVPGESVNTGVVSNYWLRMGEDGTMLSRTPERDHGADLNGDGDLSDSVIRYLRPGVDGVGIRGWRAPSAWARGFLPPGSRPSRPTGSSTTVCGPTSTSRRVPRTRARQRQAPT
jgi:hypothetical protein